MLKSVTTFLAIVLIAVSAQAGLTLDVSGVPGSGSTTWTFGGTPGSAAVDGSIRDNSNNTFNAGDTGQFPFGMDTILDGSISDTVFPLAGTATVTVGGTTEAITGIFLDDDGGSADDMGIRAAAELAYLVGDASTWGGSGTAAIDINTFSLGLWSLNSTDGQAMFIDDPILVTFAAVPEPSCLAFLGLIGLAFFARRR